MLNISEANIKFQLDNLKIKVIHINYGVFYKPFPKHRHGNRFYEAHLVTGGSGTLVADGREYPIKGGMLYMTGPMVEHEQITNTEDPMDEYCIQFEITETKGTKQGKTAKEVKIYGTVYSFRSSAEGEGTLCKRRSGSFFRYSGSGTAAVLLHSPAGYQSAGPPAAGTVRQSGTGAGGTCG